jgi:hypothetical protein
LGGTRTSVGGNTTSAPGFNPFGGVRTGVGPVNPLGGDRTSVSGDAAAPDAPAGGDAAVTKGGSAYRANQRAALFAEYDKWSPEQKRTLQNVMRAENANSTQDVLESLANRVPGEKGTKANRGGTLWEGLSSGFYSSFPAAQAAARSGKGDIAAADKAAAIVRGGSDTLQGRSDQGMWTDPGHRDMHAPGAAPGTGLNALGVARRLKYINGEWYSDKGSISLAARDKDLAAQAAYDAAVAATQKPATAGTASTAPPSDEWAETNKLFANGASKMKVDPALEPGRKALDSNMGNEITSRVEGSGTVKVEVGSNGAAPSGKNRAKLFSKNMTPRPRQMEPAETGPPASHDEAAWT